ncbi:hypothetical protein HMPREF6123_1399 [Oribacterium sinus F0268]|uniref:Uncharacterized protein n=1 Tax=Oribacterium sinus F0268 TaxID=585501 RepID=C2KY10_9FIRM|nr:hypothetical protein HMPREF6123_1399 [Oribacterium sinus F0268]
MDKCIIFLFSYGKRLLLAFFCGQLLFLYSIYTLFRYFFILYSNNSSVFFLYFLKRIILLSLGM